MYFRVQLTGTYAYLQLIESFREIRRGGTTPPPCNLAPGPPSGCLEASTGGLWSAEAARPPLCWRALAAEFLRFFLL